MIKTGFIAALLLSLSTLSASCCGGTPGVSTFQQNALQNDIPLIRKEIDTKRSIPIEEKTKNLSYSGDLRVLWAHTREKIPSYGPNCACIPCDVDLNDRTFSFPNNAYGIEFNFYVDYVQQDAWGVVWVQYSNVAGLVGALRDCKVPKACRGSGTCEGVCLRKAYMGYNILADGCARIDIEVGRRPLWSIFDSRVEFNQNFDGILLSNAFNIMDCSDVYLNVGGFVIDERSHHYGVVSEAGYLNILNSGFDFKYSIIKWDRSGTNRCGVKNPFGTHFVVSQFLGYYNLDFDFLWNCAKVYGAYLVNTNAPSLRQFNYERHNQGYYVGFLIGQVCTAGDWALDVNYQHVEALCVPECDLAGIGLGNAQGSCLACATNPGSALGITNYQGWRFEALYAITDNLVFDLLAQFSHQLDYRLGGKHNYSEFRLQAIYAF